jgi:hypothetical protein
MSERKTALTPEEKITAAFMHYVRCLDQQDIAMLYGVNIGRVNEACIAIARTVGIVSGNIALGAQYQQGAAWQGTGRAGNGSDM